MGCGGSEEGDDEQGGVTVEEHHDAPAPQPERCYVRLYVEREAEKDLVVQTCWCEPEMLLVGLLDEAIALAGWEGKAWEDVGLAVAGLSSPLDMVTVNHSLSFHAPQFKQASLKDGAWGLHVYAFLNTDAEAAADALKFASDCPSATPAVATEKELSRRAGQLQVRVFAAVPADPADESFGGEGKPAEDCSEPGKTIVYEAKLWATGKVLVGAIIDAANTALSKVTGGLTFGAAETVTSYVLGDGGDQEHPLLDFEPSDEVEDLDGFEELVKASPPRELQFIIYNKVEEAKPACQVTNFWGAPAMMAKYQEQAADLADRIAPEHTVVYEVPDWVALIQAVLAR